MSTLDKREEGFEKKFALDEEQKFKAEARRNRLLGLWAAEKLGITGDAATAYAKEVVAADFEEAGDADVLRKVMADFAAKNVAVTEQGNSRQDERADRGGGGRGEGREIRRSIIPGPRLRRAPGMPTSYPSLNPYSGTLPLAP
ncbi:hypothetical protein ACVWXM_007248 [Bradyrhizobium sp. GM7.3]